MSDRHLAFTSRAQINVTAPNTLIEVKDLSKRYGETATVDGISLSLRENELFALLGPPGAGKTTLLRMIAGFETPDAGSIHLDGEDLRSVQPNQRPINMMFQSDTLFPHLSVRDNVGFGLRMERVRGADLRDRVDEALGMVRLTDLADRKPERLSRAQRQRVALARSLVKRPRLLLLDEPLGTLDRKQREHMQGELKQLQAQTGITFLMVTHDQEQALAMADRIALINHGRLEQVGSPADLYELPQNRFVADFIGTMNFIDARVTAPDVVEVPGIGSLPAVCIGHADDSPVSLAVRPERIILSPPDDAGLGDLAHVTGRVADIAYSGRDLAVHVEIDGLTTPMIARLNVTDPMATRLDRGTQIRCHWHPLHARVFEA